METAVTTNPRVPLNPAEPVVESRFANNAPPSPSAQRVPQSAVSRWLNHLAVALFVVFCTIIGVWLALLPWSLQWTDNPLLWTHPDLRTFLGYGFVRGVCSGLGILDLWIGIREASHYYERLGTPR